MCEPPHARDTRAIEIGDVLMRAVAHHTTSVARMPAIPHRCVCDLLVAVLLTEERIPARDRLEHALGRDFSQLLVKALIGSDRKV